MKYLFALLAICTMPFTTHAANAPSQQKVIREVNIKASPEKVWALVKTLVLFIYGTQQSPKQS